MGNDFLKVQRYHDDITVHSVSMYVNTSQANLVNQLFYVQGVDQSGLLVWQMETDLNTSRMT
jgi:hypothetical protein